MTPTLSDIIVDIEGAFNWFEIVMDTPDVQYPLPTEPRDNALNLVRFLMTTMIDAYEGDPTAELSVENLMIVSKILDWIHFWSQ